MGLPSAKNMSSYFNLSLQYWLSDTEVNGVQILQEEDKIRAARMHGYKQPLVLEDVKAPDMAADEVLIKVTAAGMRRTDAQPLDGYFKDSHSLAFPNDQEENFFVNCHYCIMRWRNRE